MWTGERTDMTKLKSRFPQFCERAQNFAFMKKNSEEIEVREYLKSFVADSIVFKIAVKKYKDQDIQNCKFCLLFRMGVGFGLLHWDSIVGLSVFENVVLRETFDLRERC